MITEKQKQIIRLLLTNKQGYNINQIARILNISVSWCHETLKNLEREKILTSAKIANSVFFKVNWEDQKAEKICDFVLLDDQSKTNEPEKNETKQIQPPTRYISNRASQENTNVYSLGSTETNKASIESPYRQAIIQNNINNFSYSIVPMGEQGVSGVLSAYASSGAFTSPGGVYNSSSVYSKSSPVPPGTLGSRLSSNIEGYTLPMHTAAHKNADVPGCRYCGPEIKVPF